jgi:diadenosine tetraphosphatase ApaH/serine/threonine PP2A family protein phosphatase
MRTIFIGDVHGCAAELEDLLTAVDYHQSQDRLLLTGDAFARGPDPLGVWRIIGQTNAEMVLGNHDAGLLERLESWAAGREPKLKNPDQRHTWAQLEPAHNEILAWLQQVPLYIEDEAFLLVHAGIHPEKGLAGTSRDEFLAIRTWPPTKGIEGPRWHDHYQPTYPLLVFGHDAPGGLVVKKRNRHPYVLGLDTGCVYGNQLTAYILEEDRLIQVPSRQKQNEGLHRDT